MRLPLAALAAALFLLSEGFFGGPALAQQQVQCTSWDNMRDALYTKYGEQPAFTAITEGGSVVIITVNPTTKTWTVLSMQNPDSACMVAAGNDWGAAPDGIKAKPGQGT